MLDDVMATCSHSQECSILFYEEMSSVVADLSSSILSYLCEQVTTLFQDTFLVETADGLPEDLSVPVEFLYALDDMEEGSIALNLLPMLLASSREERGGGRRRSGGDDLAKMAAQFHLIRMCEQKLNGNLEAVDALLGQYEIEWKLGMEVIIFLFHSRLSCSDVFRTDI